MRLIDADELKIDYGFSWDDITPTHEEMIAVIERQPTIDAVPVVRCRECVHYIKHDKRCGIWNHGGIVPYGFCFLGERRTDEYS